MFVESCGWSMPDDPYDQLRLLIEATFAMWDNKQAVEYRRLNKLSENFDIAISIAAVILTNLNDESGIGRVLTRNPSTGEKALYGEFLPNVRVEEVVAGIRTPWKISQLQNVLPATFAQLQELSQRLEAHYLDARDAEFRVESGRLYVLQTRPLKRTARAAVRMLVDMVNEGLIGKHDALRRADTSEIVQLLLPQFDQRFINTTLARGDLLVRGLNISPGAATGKAVFDASRAAELGRRGDSVILVRQEMKAEDIHGVLYSQGVLTSGGGATSHAAVVTRGIGKPCISCMGLIEIDIESRCFTAGSHVVSEGDEISIDGTTGEVYKGLIPIDLGSLKEQAELAQLLSWADEVRKLGVRANADNAHDARRALEFGADGIGLCRTEHMFFQEDRLPLVRRMIVAAAAPKRLLNVDSNSNSDSHNYAVILHHLETLQTSDFREIFGAMGGYPIVIRLLDLPMHEFLPSYDQLLEELYNLRQAGKMGSETYREIESLLNVAEDLREHNPMLGLRGSRLGILYPEIYEMQVRAILNAAAELIAQGRNICPEILIPMIGTTEELLLLSDLVGQTAAKVSQAQALSVPYKLGTMIEVPRAAIIAGELAAIAEFFSFGTNDLTQMTFGYSRDDAEGKFLRQYLQAGVLPINPFQTLDLEGVGFLVELASQRGREVRPGLELGMCGEHGGDARSIAFCQGVGLNYVSCSPLRVPVARLATAQAVLQGPGSA